MATAYEPVIGLEVHAQLHSRSKLFCACSTEYGAPPNTHVCPVCLGLPGALPVPNGRAIEMAAQAAMALGCTVNSRSRFARKNYFYPDLAKGYQISQFELPLNERGRVDIEVGGQVRSIGITRVHVEEDAAKNLHGVGAGAHTLVDFNRAGVPLIETVSEPDLRSAEEAEAYLKRLREVFMFVGVNDGNLEEGSFRCDANVSIRPVGTEAFGVRVELKNINSFRFVRKAIEHEIARQEAVLLGGGQVVQETRTWSEGQGKTLTMRSKEEAHDYRYFPDPDLPPLVLAEERIEAFRQAMPELPEAMRQRWQKELGLTAYDAGVLTSHPCIARYFDEAAAALAAAMGKGAQAKAGKKAANFIQGEVLRDVATDGLEAHFPVTAGQVAELLALVEDGTISGKMAKDVYARMAETGRGARRIVEAEGLSQVTDTSAIEAEVQKVLDANPGEVDKYREGKTSLLGFFVGQVMKATRGAANPKMVNEILQKRLSG
jgi:aspartyl-tRNA(Asn)/glutamyl-tRNA(Gln) amidotransferase subunit B